VVRTLYKALVQDLGKCNASRGISINEVCFLTIVHSVFSIYNGWIDCRDAFQVGFCL